MTADRKTILIIEDEKDIVMGLTDAFTFEGYEVHSAPNGEDGVALASKTHPDLVILDLMLPGMNGYQVCGEIRRFDSAMPILILSARSQENDIIRGLEAGADDYVTKPFSIGELLARVRAMFRRMTHAAERRASKVISVGDATVDMGSYSAKIGNRHEDLGFYAAAILQVLDEHRGEPVSRDDILDAV